MAALPRCVLGRHARNNNGHMAYVVERTLFDAGERASAVRFASLAPACPSFDVLLELAKAHVDVTWAGTWAVYVDGSGTHHADSPACIGAVVVLPNGWLEAEASEFVCRGTSNVAELWAIHRGLELLEAASPLGIHQPAELFSDSQYALGIARGDFVATKNRHLADQVAVMAFRFTSLTLHHVHGHNHDAGNELADWLAGLARRRTLRARGETTKPDKRRPVDGEWLELVKHPKGHGARCPPG